MRSRFTTSVDIAAVCVLVSGTTTVALASDTLIVVGGEASLNRKLTGEQSERVPGGAKPAPELLCAISRQARARGSPKF
jgi:hypothetical protein